MVNNSENQTRMPQMTSRNRKFPWEKNSDLICQIRNLIGQFGRCGFHWKPIATNLKKIARTDASVIFYNRIFVQLTASKTFQGFSTII